MPRIPIFRDGVQINDPAAPALGASSATELLFAPSAFRVPDAIPAPPPVSVPSATGGFGAAGPVRPPPRTTPDLDGLSRLMQVVNAVPAERRDQAVRAFSNLALEYQRQGLSITDGLRAVRDRVANDPVMRLAMQTAARVQTGSIAGASIATQPTPTIGATSAPPPTATTSPPLPPASLPVNAFRDPSAPSAAGGIGVSGVVPPQTAEPASPTDQPIQVAEASPPADEQANAPSAAAIRDFLRDNNDPEIDDAIFMQRADAAGLDPKVALLFRDMLRVDNESFDRVRDRIGELFPERGAVRLLLENTFQNFRFNDDPAVREDALEAHFKFARKGSREPGAFEAVSGIAGALIPGAPRRPPGSRGGSNPQQPPSGSKRQAKPSTPKTTRQLNRNVDDSTQRAERDLGWRRVREETAEDVNRTNPRLTNPPPAKPGTKAWTMEAQGVPQGQFVRLHSADNPNRRWIVRRDQVVDKNGNLLPKEELRRRFAIPNQVDRISDVRIPASQKIEIRISTTNPNLQGQGGNVVQYEIRGTVDKRWIVNTRMLK